MHTKYVVYKHFMRSFKVFKAKKLNLLNSL